MTMDNVHVHVVGAWSETGPDDLLPVLTIALNHNHVCAAFAVVDGVLLLYWKHVAGRTTPLLAPIEGPAALRTLVVSWLLVQPMVREIVDGDADEERGAFEASTDRWGHGGGDPYAMLAIKPRTRWLGK